ncbi:hypothetical protein KEM09_03210 [Carboxylicivirga mesophila]|uniref:Uncharacterized protein n=1 Tax=Carboxylicivirga mesophila TaxID=1166478 RepID=A0ABS5K5Y9_9BACT|nr:hypothetical protein [Carboxylicivirga mesophila]MBS2210390.1 hypothetical protein [Carboxylicivirga mesophila]
MLPQLNSTALRQACGREDLIRKAAAQIIKDFAEFGFEVSFSGDVEGFYEEVFRQMKVHIESIMGEHYSQFLNFLYRIDVTEGQVAVYQREMGDVSYEDALTELIIHREMKKVMIREYFKAQSQSKDSGTPQLSD